MSPKRPRSGYDGQRFALAQTARPPRYRGTGFACAEGGHVAERQQLRIGRDERIADRIDESRVQLGVDTSALTDPTKAIVTSFRART
jgi:hypothetical protein